MTLHPTAAPATAAAAGPTASAPTASTIPAATAAPAAAWDHPRCLALIDELTELRQTMLAAQRQLAGWIDAVAPEHRASACNLAHFLVLRRQDRRPLQERLADLGLSSLGRSEGHVLANLDKVLGALHALVGQPWQPQRADEPIGFHGSAERLRANACTLLGAPPAGREVRIMVTLPGEAAARPELVDALVTAGMDIARINCAHDGPEAWQAMARHVRRAARRLGRGVQIHMDLGGPKLRTDALPEGPAVLKIKPQRDAQGRVTTPARLRLCPLPAGPATAAGTAPAATATTHDTANPATWPAEVDGVARLGVSAADFARLHTGLRLTLTDARGARRRLRVVERHVPASGHDAWVLLETAHTLYLEPGSRLQPQDAAGAADAPHPRGAADAAGAGTAGAACDAGAIALHGIRARPGELQLHLGDRLRLLPPERVPAPRRGGHGTRTPPAVGCTLPQALTALREGDPVWFDDGRIGAVVRQRLKRGGVELEITAARPGGETLRADKGLNLPATPLHLPALTPQDLQDLAVVARLADTVGLSFAQSADDVRHLRQALAEHGMPGLGVVLKVETARGFRHLPEMLFAALEGPAAGVMIARGDLAVELGYERLAEVQEEMLWACEAAHLPVIWATQVLDTLAKTGLPSRAEITDAAMGGRAECVMLNKGPHITGAMRTLDAILRRMQQHQSKKRPLLRALAAWPLATEGTGGA